MSKEIPILFSPAMVAAIIAGRKTMTRRIVKFPKDFDGKDVYPNGQFGLKYSSNEFDGCVHRLSSKWQVGDILYVRENWKLVSWNFEDGYCAFEYEDGKREAMDLRGGDYEDSDYEWLCKQVAKLEKSGIYVSDGDESLVRSEKKQPFSPSIHLPKFGSRIWLEVTDTKAEPLNIISWEDAVAEGCPGYRPTQDEPTDQFKRLWKSINGEDSWDKNPWVWAVLFKVLSTTGKP